LVGTQTAPEVHTNVSIAAQGHSVIQSVSRSPSSQSFSQSVSQPVSATHVAARLLAHWLIHSQAHCNSHCNSHCLSLCHSHQSHGESASRPASQSVSQSVSPPISQPVSQTVANHNNHSVTRTTQCNLALCISHTHSNCLSLRWQPFQSHPTHYVTAHSLTHAARHTCTQFSGLLSLMPLPLTWLHPLMLLSHSVRCALRYLAITISRRFLSISHALTITLSTCSHAKAKCLLSPSPSHTCRCPGRTEVEDHDS
jgi:hypothetical protein